MDNAARLAIVGAGPAGFYAADATRSPEILGPGE
jgi:thioredoxin reductase